MSKNKSASSVTQEEEMANSMDVASGDDESCELRAEPQRDKDGNNNRSEKETHNSKCKTSFSVDDILSPSKFNGQMTSLAPEYFMRWQPWLMQEALRQNCPFPDLALSFYKPFLVNSKDGKLPQMCFTC